jgi:hypothetical protein
LGVSGDTAICFGISNRRDHGFGCFASCAIIGAQIKPDLVRFDPRQYQWSAAPGTGWPEVIDESEVERIDHDAAQGAPSKTE